MPSTPVANNDGFSEPIMGVATSSAKLDASRAGVTQHVNVMLLSAKCEYTLRCLSNWQLPCQLPCQFGVCLFLFVFASLFVQFASLLPIIL